MRVMGREIPDDDIRVIAGARCWIVDGYIVKAVRRTDRGSLRWRAEADA